MEELLKNSHKICFCGKIRKKNYSKKNMTERTQQTEIRPSNRVFRENRWLPPPSPHTHTHHHLEVFLWLWPLKFSQGHKNLISSLHVPIIYPWKFGKNPTTGSQDIVQTRKCDSDVDANTYADANGIHTKINMSSSPEVGVHNNVHPCIPYFDFRRAVVSF